MKIFTPHPYQVEGIKFLLTTMHAGLIWKPGLGKTVSVLTALKILKDKGMLRRALIVAPRQVACNVWPDELRKWAHISGLTLDVLHGSKKADILANSTADIVVVTPEGLSWLAQYHGAGFDKVNADVLIVDESSYFRHGTSQRFKNLKERLHTFPRRIILTGTPTPLGYEDLFTQAYILDMGGALGRYITHYRMRYFTNEAPPGSTYGVWRLRNGAQAEINERLKPLMLHSDAFGTFHMPDLIHQPLMVELPPKARAEYNEFEKQFYLMLATGEEISSPNAAAKANKLRQIANGFAYDSLHDGVPIHNEKIERLSDLVRDLQGEPALVLYEYNADKARILKAIPGAVCLTDAGNNTGRVIADFNAGAIPVLLAHPASAGHGLNLQGSAMHVVWFGPTWNLEHAEQATARVWRQGNPNRQVFVHTLIARNTMDERVAKVLESKDRTQKSLLEALKRPQPQAVVVDEAHIARALREVTTLA